MKLHLSYYGILTELAGKSAENLVLDENADIQTLETHLTSKYPDFGQYPLVFFADQTMCSPETPLTNNQKVECMPPFAGG